MFLVRKYSIYILLRNTLAMFTRSCVDTNSNKFNKKTPVFSYFVDTFINKVGSLTKSLLYVFIDVYENLCTCSNTIVFSV